MNCTRREFVGAAATTATAWLLSKASADAGEPKSGTRHIVTLSFDDGFKKSFTRTAEEREIERLLAKDSGWLIFNTHGLDEEGWGPIRASYLERLLERLLGIETVAILPAGRALAKHVS